MKSTIITVCKNPGELIKKTVESVISQTYKDIEYIIVDGRMVEKTRILQGRHTDLPLHDYTLTRANTRVRPYLSSSPNPTQAFTTP
jgi:GT2 family glycosyltransferase